MECDLSQELYESNRIYLTKCGLTLDEATTMLELFKKMTIPEDDEELFYSEMEESFPFEGGMSFTEGVIGATLALDSEIIDRVSPKETPIWPHDCKLCTFLGNFDNGEEIVYDLYHCIQNGRATLIARYGEDGDYHSGLLFGIEGKYDPRSPMGEVWRRAVEKNLFVMPTGGLAPEEEPPLPTDTTNHDY